MKKTFVVIAAIIGLPLALSAADRVVCLELFCRTACTYCPLAAIGADAVGEDHRGEVLLVEYHLSDPFQNNESVTRAIFYQGTEVYIPCAIFDGVIKYLGPDNAVHYEDAFQTRKEKAAPLEITLEKTEDAYLSGGTLTATIENTSEEPITGVVHFTITESNIRYSWVHSKSWVHFCLRDMLADANGAEITLAPGADTSISRDYEINPGWPYHTDDLENIEFGCFVQDTAVYSGKLKEIFQGAVIPLANPLSVEEVIKTPTYEILTSIGSRITLRYTDCPEGLHVAVFDASGRKVDELYAPTQSGTLSWGDNQPEGIYFIVPQGLKTAPVKVILIR